MRKIPPYQLLDAWRGIASLWVVMCHACVPFVTTHLEFANVPFYAVCAAGQLGVVLFFVISGYCIVGAAYGALAAGKTVSRYARDRFRRIYPPYFAACVAAVAVELLTTFAQSSHIIPPSNHHATFGGPLFWLANLTILQVELHQPTLLIVLWTLCYEVVFYAIVGLFLWIALRIARGREAVAGLPLLFGGVTLCTMLSLGWLILSPKTCPFPLDRWYQFGLGGLLFLTFAGNHAASGSRPFRWLTDVRVHLGAACALTLLFACATPLSTSMQGLTEAFILGQPSTRWQASLNLAFVLVLWALRPFDARLAHSRALRPFMALGVISYSLYLSHTLVQNVVDTFGRRIGFDSGKYWVTFLAEILVSLLAGWLFYLVIERHFISSQAHTRVKKELNLPEPTAEQERLRMSQTPNFKS